MELEEYKQKLERQIKYHKQKLKQDMGAIRDYMDSLIPQLEWSMENPQSHVVNGLGELQSNAAILNARCGELYAECRIYRELSTLP